MPKEEKSIGRLEKIRNGALDQADSTTMKLEIDFFKKALESLDTWRLAIIEQSEDLRTAVWNRPLWVGRQTWDDTDSESNSSYASSHLRIPDDPNGGRYIVPRLQSKFQAENVLKRLKATLKRLRENLTDLTTEVDEKMAVIVASGYHHPIPDANEEEPNDIWNHDLETSSEHLSESRHSPEQPISLLYLPSELLIDIVMEAMNHDQHVPVTLSHVNRGLRALATTTSIFWTTIDIMYGLSRVHHHLERSGDASIDVTASLPPSSTPEKGVEKILKFVAKVHPHGNRIRDLHMVFVRQEWPKAAMPLLEVIPTQLRVLQVGLHNANTMLPEAYACKVECEPRQLRLHGKPAWTIRPSLWSRVTTFEFRDGEWHRQRILRDTLCGWLSHMPAITSLTLVDVLLLQTTTPSTTLTLSNLQEVRLQRMGTSDVVGLWEQLETPQLTSLTIDLRRLWPAPESSSLISVATANPQLRQLDLANIYTSDEQWSDLFHSLPNLTHLRLAACNLTVHSLSALSGHGPSDGDDGSRSYACPELAHLTFDNELGLASGPVREIVAARRPFQDSRIRSVVMRGVDGDLMEEADVEEILSSVDHFLLDVVDVEGVLMDVEDRNEYTYDSDDDSDDDGSVGSWTSGDRFVAQLTAPQIL